MNADRITSVRAAEEHYHHQTKLMNLTKPAILHYSCSPVQVLLAWQLRSSSGSSHQHLSLKEMYWVWSRPIALIKNMLICALGDTTGVRLA